MAARRILGVHAPDSQEVAGFTACARGSVFRTGSHW